jgi:thiamine-monophosphate kinase
MAPITIMDEHAAIRAIRAHDLPGSDAMRNGDDATPVLVPGGRTCVSTDTTIAGVHVPDGTAPHTLGRRAAARALSDLAAMAAAPIGLTCAVILGSEESWQDAVDALEGVRARGHEQGAPLLGGDLARAPSGSAPLSLVITVLGRPAGSRGTWTSRGGMQPGDRIAVTGVLGAAGEALRTHALELPEPPDRIPLAIALAPFVHAAIDISDGVATDLLHLVEESSCGARVDLDRLPCATGVDDPICAATDGDDYELLLAIPERHAGAAELAAHAAAPGVPLTWVGAATEAAGAAFHRSGAPVVGIRGFRH